MNYTKMKIALFIVLIVVSACGPVLPKTPYQTSNKIILLFPDASTNVELKRDEWDQYVPVGFGTILRNTDLIKSDGTGSIICPDLSVQPIPEQGRPPCAENPGWLNYNKYEFGTPRGTLSQEIPYIIYPRNTSILSHRPLLFWHDTGASSYTISIVKNGRAVWENENVSGSSAQYPDSVPPLTAGVDYLFVVTDNDTGHSSSEDPAKGLGFEVLGEDSQTILLQHKNEIMDQVGLDDPAKKLTLAIYYINLDLSPSRRIFGEAWMLLDDMSKSHDEAMIFYQLGNVYAAISLSEYAITSYNESFEFAERRGELEAQAASSSQLWRLTGTKNYFDQAIQIYKQIGDEGSILALENEK